MGINEERIQQLAEKAVKVGEVQGVTPTTNPKRLMIEVYLPNGIDDITSTEKEEQPHICPTCDGYGYLVKFPGWDTPITVKTSMESLDRKCIRNNGVHSYDIPCPDCNEVE